MEREIVENGDVNFHDWKSSQNNPKVQNSMAATKPCDTSQGRLKNINSIMWILPKFIISPYEDVNGLGVFNLRKLNLYHNYFFDLFTSSCPIYPH